MSKISEASEEEIMRRLFSDADDEVEEVTEESEKAKTDLEDSVDKLKEVLDVDKKDLEENHFKGKRMMRKKDLLNKAALKEGLSQKALEYFKNKRPAKDLKESDTAENGIFSKKALEYLKNKRAAKVAECNKTNLKEDGEVVAVEEVPAAETVLDVEKVEQSINNVEDALEALKMDLNLTDEDTYFDVDDTTDVMFGDEVIGEEEPAAEDAKEATDEEKPAEDVVDVEKEIEIAYDDEDLDDDTKLKLEAIASKIKADLNEKHIKFAKHIKTVANEKMHKMEENMKQKIAKQAIAKFANSLSQYTDYIANKWLEENKIAAEEQLQNRLTESFIRDMKKVFLKHNLDIPKGKSSLIEELNKKYNSAKEENDKLLKENASYRNALLKYKKNEKFNKICEGLTETQKEELAKMASSIEFDDNYEKKIGFLKEKYIQKSKSNVLKEKIEKATKKVEERRNRMNKLTESKVDEILANRRRRPLNENNNSMSKTDFEDLVAEIESENPFNEGTDDTF